MIMKAKRILQTSPAWIVALGLLLGGVGLTSVDGQSTAQAQTRPQSADAAFGGQTPRTPGTGSLASGVYFHSPDIAYEVKKTSIVQKERTASQAEAAPQLAGTCLQSVESDGTIEGTWDDTCLSEKEAPSGEGDRYARFYTFTLDESADIVVSLDSVEDTYLYILSGHGTDGSTQHENDDVEYGANLNSLLSVTLQPGDYTIEATTYNAETGGSFTLNISGLPGDTGPSPDPTASPAPEECAEHLTEDGSTTGTWSSDCESEGRSGSYARYFTFTLEEVTEVGVRLESAEDTYLFLREGSGRNGRILHEHDDIEKLTNTNSMIYESLQPGDYTIEATTYHPARTGEFTLTVWGLSVTVEPPVSPAPEPSPEPSADECLEAVTRDGSIVGNWIAGCESEGRSGSYALYYSFALTRNTEIAIRLDSVIDTYLYVREGEGRDGTVLHEHDDIERLANTNSMIRETLTAGIYTVEATTYESGVAGEFTLTISGLPDDREALVALYNATDGPNWVDNHNWLSDAPIHEWSGVGVDEYGRVTNLYLGGRQMTGELPPELGSLDSLREIRLGTNSLSGGIPEELGNLTSLTHLHLDTNWLSGEIPPELGNLTNLTELLLYGNQLSGEIPPELGDLSRLTALDLGYNQLSGGIPPELGRLTNLTVLHLDGNHLSGEVPAELGNLSSLTWLQLENNRLSGEIPSSLGSLSNLQSLYLFSNNFSGDIPPELGDLSSLTNLVLSDNNLSGDIPPELGNLSNLTGLWLRANHLSGEIPPELGNLSNLLNLFLQDNNLTGEIPAELGNLSNLRYLRLWRNDLSGGIPPELGRLSNLLQIHLGFNQLTGEIPPELGNLSNLNVLSLSGNELAGDIPPELGSLSNLTELWLQENRLSGQIPPELGNLSNLELLVVWENQLTGEIPPVLGSLTGLEALDASRNRLSGQIPPELGRLSNLKFLGLAENELGGSIPSDLSNLSGLEDLYLHKNRLTGEIPRSLGGLSNLENLILGENSLSGEIPPELGNLSFLRTLSLHKNTMLSGTVPPEVLNLPDLQAMELYGTGLSLDAPDYPAERAALTAFYSSTGGDDWTDNFQWMSEEPTYRWYGVGIDSNGHVTLLALQENGLSGSPPAEIGNLSFLKYLYLYDNQLTGEIPPEIGSLSELLELYLNGNELTGMIPGEIGNLANLKRLYLRGNPLTGCVPTAVVRLGLELHDLDELDLETCEDEMSEGQSRLSGFAGTVWQEEFSEMVTIDPPGMNDR